ncbi:hypothetical protein ACFWNK_17130 [Streptomyces sp. NPDC058417]|uniref:hypothetical protein n=1 Tax=unclassified Streptomyces TaxID=2593676 RepID=UPI0036592830
MYEYEMQQARSADLIRRADEERLAREAVRLRREARREAAARADRATAPESGSHTRFLRRHRSARTA